MFVFLIQPEGTLQNVGLLIVEFAKALTALYCCASKSKLAVKAMKKQNSCVADVAAKVSMFVCCKFFCATSCALNLVSQPNLSNLYLQVYIVDTRTFFAYIAPFIKANTQVFFIQCVYLCTHCSFKLIAKKVIYQLFKVFWFWRQIVSMKTC